MPAITEPGRSGTGAPDPRRTAGTGEEQGELVVKDFAHPAYRLVTGQEIEGDLEW